MQEASDTAALDPRSRPATQHVGQGEPPLGVPEMGDVGFDTLREALRRGWRDMRRAPLFAIAIAGIYVVLGWAMYWITEATGQTYWLVLAAVGFPLFSPFAAVAFYDVSRRFARGAPMDMKKTLTVVLRQSKRQLPSICAIIVVMFLFWFFVAHMIFALFLGHSAMTNISSSLEVYTSAQGLKMLGFGTLIGAGFALLLYMITVLALPLLLDREVDFVTAMITSFSYVQQHPMVMLPWAAFIAGLTFVSMLPGFFGLLISLPLLGHATWHLYDMLAYGTQERG